MDDTSAKRHLVISQEWTLHYEYSCGLIVSHFLSKLREGSIEAVKCPKCGMVWLPPRSYCERCFVETKGWVSVGPEGALEAFTIVNQQFENLPTPPYVVAFCRLDGADTALANFLKMKLENVEEAAQRLKPGTRIRVRFHESRSARITDFHYELLE